MTKNSKQIGNMLRGSPSSAFCMCGSINAGLPLATESRAKREEEKYIWFGMA